MDYRLVATKYYYGAGAAVCEEEFIHADSRGRLVSGLGLGLRLGLGLGIRLGLGFIHADSTGRLGSGLAPNPKP